nr:hypothetical protein [Deltaproteobacteria bacterium]
IAHDVEITFPRERPGPRAATPSDVAQTRGHPVARIVRAPSPAIISVEPADAPSAEQLAGRYVVVGEALAKAGAKPAADVDALWTQYRRIQLQRATETPASRIAALRSLEAIARNLR